MLRVMSAIERSTGCAWQHQTKNLKAVTALLFFFAMKSIIFFIIIIHDFLVPRTTTFKMILQRERENERGFNKKNRGRSFILLQCIYIFATNSCNECQFQVRLLHLFFEEKRQISISFALFILQVIIPFLLDTQFNCKLQNNNKLIFLSFSVLLLVRTRTRTTDRIISIKNYFIMSWLQ